MDQPSPLYRLTLRPITDPVPAVTRLRRLLKGILRVYAFRCVEVEELPPRALPSTDAIRNMGDPGLAD